MAWAQAAQAKAVSSTSRSATSPLLRVFILHHHRRRKAKGVGRRGHFARLRTDAKTEDRLQYAEEIEVDRIANPVGIMTDVEDVDSDYSASYDRFDKSYEVDYEVESMAGQQYTYTLSEERDDHSVRCTETGYEVRLGRFDSADGGRIKLPKIDYDPAFFDECNRLLAKLDSSSHHDLSLRSSKHLLENARLDEEVVDDEDEVDDEVGAGAEGDEGYPEEGLAREEGEDSEEGVENVAEEAPANEEGEPVRRNELRSLLMRSFQQEFNERCGLAEIDGPLRPGQHRIEKGDDEDEDEEVKAKKRRWLEKIDRITREDIQLEGSATGLKTVTEESEENAISGSIHSGGTDTTTVHTNQWDAVSITDKFEMARCAINGKLFATQIIEDTNHILEDLNAAADEAEGCGTTGGAQSGPGRSKDGSKEEQAGDDGARPSRPPAAITKRSNRKMLSTIDEPACEGLSSPRDNLPPSTPLRPSSPRKNLPPVMSPSVIRKRITINNLSSDDETTRDSVPKMYSMPVSPSSFQGRESLPKSGSDAGIVAREAEPPVEVEPTSKDTFFTEIKRKAWTSSVTKSVSESDKVLHLVTAAAHDAYREDTHPAAQVFNAPTLGMVNVINHAPDDISTLASERETKNAEPAASFVSDDDALLRRKRWNQANARQQKKRILEKDMSFASLPVGHQPEIVPLPDDEKKDVALACLREEKIVLPFDETCRSVMDERRDAQSARAASRSDHVDSRDVQSAAAFANKCHSIVGTQSVQAETSRHEQNPHFAEISFNMTSAGVGAGPSADGEQTGESRTHKSEVEETFSTSHKVTISSLVNGRRIVERAAADDLSAMSLGQSTLTSRLTLGDVEKEERVACAIESQLAAVEEVTVDKENASSNTNSVGTSQDEEVASKAPSLSSLTTSVRYQTEKIAQLEAEAQRRWKEAELAAAASRKALQEMADRRSRAKKEAPAKKQETLTGMDQLDESGADLSMCSTLSSYKNSSKYSAASLSQYSQSQAIADPAATAFPSTFTVLSNPQSSAEPGAKSKKSTRGLEPEVREPEEADTARIAVGPADLDDTKRERVPATPPVQVRSSILPPQFRRSHNDEEDTDVDDDDSTTQSISTTSSYQSDRPSRSMSRGSGYMNHRSSSAPRTRETLQSSLLLPSLNSPSRSRLRDPSPRSMSSSPRHRVQHKGWQAASPVLVKPNFLKPYSNRGEMPAADLPSGHQLYKDAMPRAHPRGPVSLRPSLAVRTSSDLIAGRRKPSLAVRTATEPVSTGAKYSSLAARTARLPPRMNSLTPRTDFERFTFDSDERSRRRQAANRGFDSLLLAPNQTVRERMSNNSDLYGQTHRDAARERMYYIPETLPRNIPVSPSHLSSSSAVQSHSLQHPRRSVRFAEDRFSNPAPIQQAPIQPAPIQQPPPLYHTSESMAGLQPIQLPPLQYQPMGAHPQQPIHQMQPQPIHHLQPQHSMGHPQYYQPHCHQAGPHLYRY